MPLPILTDEGMTVCPASDETARMCERGVRATAQRASPTMTGTEAAIVTNSGSTENYRRSLLAALRTCSEAASIYRASLMRCGVGGVSPASSQVPSGAVPTILHDLVAGAAAVDVGRQLSRSRMIALRRDVDPEVCRRR